ncbi:MAG: ROK family protein [Dehalococcoidia bacterium]|nr:MAG: ROK family protein [Dehalococcoidia bacterium]
MPQNAEPLVLGIDLGGTKILSAVVSAPGKILSQDYCPTPAQDYPVLVQCMLKSAHRALKQAGIGANRLAAVGIGAAGLSDPEKGILFTSPHLPQCCDVPLRDDIAKGLGAKTFITNDASAAALGEFYFGAGRGAHNFIYITISTGIGGGIIIADRLYTGSSGTAGELGHMTIADDGPPCRCGNKGCWEALASGSALSREARQRIKEGAKTSILDHAGGDIDKVTGETVQQAAEQGDALAEELIARTGYYFGIGLANLINIFNPELIVIGGGLANMGDRLLKPAFRVAEERSFRQICQKVRFARAELGVNSGVLGAAAYALQQG